MSFLAYILVAEGKPLTFYADDNKNRDFCVSESFYLDHGWGRVWMIETEAEAREAIAANRETGKPVPWYNASYHKPNIKARLIPLIKVAKAEVEFKVEFDPMPTLSLNIVGYEIVEEGGDE